MRPIAFEIRLTLPAPGMGWDYVARKQGEVIAASGGDSCFENVGPAFAACVAEINQHFAAKNRGADLIQGG
jgi:hypothetical protein